MKTKEYYIKQAGIATHVIAKAHKLIIEKGQDIEISVPMTTLELAAFMGSLEIAHIIMLEDKDEDTSDSQSWAMLLTSLDAIGSQILEKYPNEMAAAGQQIIAEAALETAKDVLSKIQAGAQQH